MIDPPETSGNPYLTERRNDRRQKVFFSSVVLSEVNCGRVLNISPNGLALQTDVGLLGDEFPHMRFKFSPSVAWIETRGRVAWRSDSRRVVGIKFIGVTDEVREQIQTWIAAESERSEFSKTTMSLKGAENVTGADAGSEIPAAAPTSLPEVVDLSAENPSQDSTVTLDRSSAETEDARTALKNAGDVRGGSSKKLWLVGLALAATLVLAVFLLRGLHLQKSGNNQKNTVTRASKPLVSSSPLVPSPPVSSPLPVPSPPVSSPRTVRSAKSPPVPSSDRKPSADVVLFVLQVGAMVHEENANALANSLRQMNFPVFVTTQPTDRFHYVLVGPYQGADAAIAAKNDLEKRGFTAIRTKWKVPSR